MEDVDLLCMWIAELVPLFATLCSFIYGLNKFFKKGEAVASSKHHYGYGMSCAWQHLAFVSNAYDRRGARGIYTGYLGRIGFFLFLITASYGQMGGN